MYLPEHFKPEETAELTALIQQYPLAVLIVTGNDGELEVNHIPLEYEPEKASYGLLKGHIAQANPLVGLLSEARSVYAVFQADQAYISPNWYKSKQQHHRVVPTWNYRVVHVKGKIRKVDDEKYLRGILARLTRTYEAAQAVPWKMGDAPNDFIEAQLGKIAAIEIEIESMIGKFKVSQNRSEADAQNIAQGLIDSCPDMAASVLKFQPAKDEAHKKTPD